MSYRFELMLDSNEKYGVINLSELNRLSIPREIIKITKSNMLKYNAQVERYNHQRKFVCLPLLSFLIILTGALLYFFQHDQYIYALIIGGLGTFLKIIYFCQRCSKKNSIGKIVKATVDQIKTRTFDVMDLQFGYDSRNYITTTTIEPKKFPKFFVFQVNIEKLKTRPNDFDELEEPFVSHN